MRFFVFFVLVEYIIITGLIFSQNSEEDFSCGRMAGGCSDLVTRVTSIKLTPSRTEKNIYNCLFTYTNISWQFFNTNIQTNLHFTIDLLIKNTSQELDMMIEKMQFMIYPDQNKRNYINAELITYNIPSQTNCIILAGEEISWQVPLFWNSNDVRIKARQALENDPESFLIEARINYNTDFGPISFYPVKIVQHEFSAKLKKSMLIKNELLKE